MAVPGINIISPVRAVGIHILDHGFTLGDGNSALLRVDNKLRLVNSPSSLCQPNAGVTNRVTSTGAPSTVHLSDTSRRVSGVLVIPSINNVNAVYVGFSSSVTDSDGLELQPGQAISIPIRDLNLVWIHFLGASDYVTYMATYDDSSDP